MKTRFAPTGLAVALLAITALAAPGAALAAADAHKSAKTATTMYECSKCHMHYTAAQAKKDHYRDPMDGGTLVPLKAAKK